MRALDMFFWEMTQHLTRWFAVADLIGDHNTSPIGNDHEK